MSQEGFEKYGANASPDAVMLVDTTLVHSRPKCRCIEIPGNAAGKRGAQTRHRRKHRDARGTRRGTHVVSETALEKAILDSVPKGTEALNQKAMKLGLSLQERYQEDKQA